MATVENSNQNTKATTTKSFFSRETTVGIYINAKPSVIWSILANADDFARWNSTIVEMSGQIEEGKKISLKSIIDLERVFNLKIELLKTEEKMVWADGQAPFFKGAKTCTLSEKRRGLRFCNERTIRWNYSPFRTSFYP